MLLYQARNQSLELPWVFVRQDADLSFTGWYLINCAVLLSCYGVMRALTCIILMGFAFQAVPSTPPFWIKVLYNPSVEGGLLLLRQVLQTLSSDVRVPFIPATAFTQSSLS